MSDASQPPPLPAAVQPAPRTEPLAIWSLVLALLSFLGCLFLTVIPAIICGHLARSKIRKSNGVLAGMNLALASLILAYIEIPIAVLGGVMLADMIRSERVRLHDLALQKKEIASDDGKLKIMTSGFWAKMTDLNKQASLQAGCKSKDMYVIVISDEKSAVGSMNLSQHHQLTRDHMMQKMTKTFNTAPVSMQIDGHPALQDQVTGATQGEDLVFLHTTIDGKDSFQQILAWTVKSRWPDQNAELHEITNSFRSEQ